MFLRIIGKFLGIIGDMNFWGNSYIIICNSMVSSAIWQLIPKLYCKPCYHKLIIRLGRFSVKKPFSENSPSPSYY